DRSWRFHVLCTHLVRRGDGIAEHFVGPSRRPRDLHQRRVLLLGRLVVGERRPCEFHANLADRQSLVDHVAKDGVLLVRGEFRGKKNEQREDQVVWHRRILPVAWP